MKSPCAGADPADYPSSCGACLRALEGTLPPAGSSVFEEAFVVSQGTPHCDGHNIPFLGHVFSSSFLLGLPNPFWAE